MTARAKYTHDMPYGLYRVPSSLETCKEHGVPEAEGCRDEELAKLLEGMRDDIKDRAKELLAQWVAEQNEEIQDRR